MDVGVRRVTKPIKPDYESLKAILEAESGEGVSLEYATGAGDFLIGVYEVLLHDDESES